MNQAICFFLFLSIGYGAKAQYSLPKKVIDSTPKAQYPVLTQNYYTKGLSFFCKKELQVQKLTSLNVYFRLGSKNYVDYLERKPNAGIVVDR
jgi:hypothetical protein